MSSTKESLKRGGSGPVAKTRIVSSVCLHARVVVTPSFLGRKKRRSPLTHRQLGLLGLSVGIAMRS